jgi:hypothetical protein
MLAALKPEGFDSSSAGYFRRKREQSVHVISVDFYTSERDAERYGSSQHGFAVEFGIHYDCIPYRGRPIKDRNPDITQCELRKQLTKIIVQPQFPNKRIWSANADLSDLPDLINDATTATQVSLPWFDYLSDLKTAYRVIGWSREDMSGTWGQGVVGSPLRLYFAAFLAKQLGKSDDADYCFRRLRRRAEKMALGFDMPRLEIEFHKSSTSEGTAED